MSDRSQQVLNQALSLPPAERAELVEELLSAFEFPTSDSIDRMWAEEAENRIKAFEDGNITSIPAKQVFDTLS